MSCPKLQAFRRRVLQVVLACAVTVAGGVRAQTAAVPQPQESVKPAPAFGGAAKGFPSSADSASTATEIQRINERMTLLQAQLTELELQAKISAKRREIDGSGTGAASASAFDTKSGLPLVQSVAGVKGRLEAVLVFPGGAMQRVKAGDIIEDRRIAKVSLNEVVLTDLYGRKEMRLGFVSVPAVREHTPAPGTSPPLPSITSPALGR